jgi:hypothetical protein
VSRSWIERARRSFAPDASAGLALGRDTVSFAHLVPAGGGWRVSASSQTQLAVPLFSGVPSPQASAALAEALRSFPAALKRRYLPVHVSLSDAAVRVAIFELEQMPKAHAAQLDLVRLRFGRLGVNGSHVFACQPLESDGRKRLLFGMAGEDTWQRVVGEALSQAGIVAWSISGNASRQFNCYNEQLTRASGALVVLAPDSWPLGLTPKDGRATCARGGAAPREDHAEIAVEAERLILAYAHGDPGRSVSQAFLVAGEKPTDGRSAQCTPARALREALAGGRRSGSPRRRGGGGARGGPGTMRISANFPAARPRLALPLAAGLWLSALALAAVAAWLAVNTLEMRAERPRLESRLARVEEQLSAAAPKTPLPPPGELESLRQRVRALNKLSGMRGWATPQLLAWLAAQLPDNVYLVSLHHKPREGEALLVAESPSAEALTGFLLRLEKEPRFAEVLLSKQGARGAPGAAAIQFEIRVRWAT